MTRELLAPLERTCPDVVFRHRVVMTSGDRDRTSELRALSDGGQGAFTTQLEAALLAREIDVAVHSLKDLPTTSPAELTLAAVPGRADPRDALCGSSLRDLPRGARVGTGSPRRTAQLLALRPDVRVTPIRGNVPPRLQKLKGSSPLDAVVLAVAGLVRLGLDGEIGERLSAEEFPPSPGQGALGVQVRADDAEVRELLAAVHDPAAGAAVEAERSLLAELRGGCSVPIGAYAGVDGAQLRLVGQVTALDGGWFVRLEATGRADAAGDIGRQLAHDLLAKGADGILAQVRSADGPPPSTSS
jgi:hydroxymethylbilane synthase